MKHSKGVLPIAACILSASLLGCGGSSGGSGGFVGFPPNSGGGSQDPGASNPSPPPPEDPLKNAPEFARMTWFGITNWHYQIGDKGVLLDGEVVNGGRDANPAAVTKALNALIASPVPSLSKDGDSTSKLSVDAILLGHIHPDHSVQLPEWAKQTGKMVYAPPAECATLVSKGIPAEQCVGLKGGEVIKLSEFASVRAVRWVHSVDCDEYSNGTGGPETFGFLFTVKTKSGKVLSWYTSDSGAGGPDLTAPRKVTTVDAQGVSTTTTYGSPLTNLKAAIKDAGLDGFDVWQGGPESRMVYQARTVIPTFGVKTFMPHHLNSRAANGQSFALTYGMHYAYSADDQPKLKEFLSALDVPQIYPTNYFDAWVYDKDGVRAIKNTAMKAVYGLPSEGAGPGQQYPNPRAGSLECPAD
jgi:hypothetical protein